MDFGPELSNTEEILELIEIILKEQYSKEISDIGRDLLFNGVSTIPEIESRLKLSFEAIKNALIVLLQNKFAVTKDVIRKETTLTGYELIADNVLSVLQYPKILNLVNQKFGESAVMIIEEFMHFGILSAGQVFEQVKSRIENRKGGNIAINKMKLMFITLITSNYIVQAAKIKVNERKLKENVRKRTNNKGGNSSQEKKTTNDNDDNNTKSNKKKNKAKDKDDEISDRLHELSNNVDKEIKGSSTKKGKKAKNETISDNNNTSNAVKEEENMLIFNKEAGKYYYFFLNYNQIISDIKSQIVIDFITQKLSSSAGLIASRLLSTHPFNSYKSGKTTSLSFTEILKDFNSLDEKKLEEIITESTDFFGQMSSKTVFLDLQVIGKALQDATMDKIVEQQFSMSHVRIFRLLSLCKALDSKNIMDICLILPKNCNLILNQLYSEGFIETQIVKVNGSSILFYSVNRSSVITRLLANCYKMIKNQKIFLTHELEKVKNTVPILMQEQYITKVYTAINELDDTIIVLKSF